MIITGSARSGTHYFAQLLRNAGIDATHEKAIVSDTEFKDFGAGTVEVNSELGFRLENVINLSEHVSAIGHVVRHPHEVVSSIMGREMFSEGWGQLRLYECPELNYWHGIDRALAYWIEINRAVDRFKPIRIPVSDPVVPLIELLEQVGIDCGVERIQASMALTDQTLGHRADMPPIEYEWEEHDPALRALATMMMRRYGL